MATAIPPDVSVQTYFEELYPRVFAAQLPTPPDDMVGRTLSCTFEVTGDGGGTYGLMNSDGGQLEVRSGGYTPSDIRVTVPIASWRTIITGGLTLPDPLITYNTPARNAKVKSTRGSLTLLVTMPDGNLTTSTTQYGEVAQPAVTLRAKVDDYTALLEGRLNPQLAFLLRKIKISGSLTFLLALNELQSG